MAEVKIPTVSTLSERPGTRKRIPMSIPRRKFETPELPGFFLYWHLEKNVPAALDAGYEFVDRNELPINQLNVATDSEVSGSVDLGNRVRMIGGVGIDGRAEYHILMKLRQEWRAEDEHARDKNNADILSGIFRGEQILDTGFEGGSATEGRAATNALAPGDENVRYVDKDRTAISKPLFQRPVRK